MSETVMDGVKTEAESPQVKVEAGAACAVCGAAGAAWPAPRSVRELVRRVARVRIDARAQCCGGCSRLLRLLERAEHEYSRLKRAFTDLARANPALHAAGPQSPGSDLDCNPDYDSSLNIGVDLGIVKREALEEVYPELNEVPDGFDSEDEPLAVTKKKRHKPGRKKKKGSSLKKSSMTDKLDSWECAECGMTGDEGGEIAAAAHSITAHGLNSALKTEDMSHCNGYQLVDGEIKELIASEIKLEVELEGEVRARRGRGRPRKVVPSRKVPVVLPCELCDSKFTSKARLERHRRSHAGAGAGAGAGRPPYICEVCGAHYKHQRACDIHIAMHKGISDWKCEQCNKLFPSKGALHRHDNIHTGKPNYQCDLCGKSFIHTSSFKMHKLAHSGVKPHKCAHCGLALMTSSHLKRHLRVHSGEKRYECAHCGRKFSERYNLAAHAKSHVALAPPSAASPASPAGAGAAPRTPEPRRHHFRCHFCTERFERRYMLERHMTAAHGRTLERPPPRPRNTMSKLLKMQAARQPEPRPHPHPHPHPHPPGHDADTEMKQSRPESREESICVTLNSHKPLSGSPTSEERAAAGVAGAAAGVWPAAALQQYSQ